MPAKKEITVEDLQKEIAALKKEIAALKKELKAKPDGGADPRVDKIVDALKNYSPKLSKALS